MRLKRSVFLFVLAPILAAAALLPAAEFRTEHVVVSYEGIGEPYAQAIGKTVEAARKACVEQYDFDMPDQITVQVSADPKQTVRLFNDGVDRFSLSVRNERDLRKPSATGTFHLYGLCHEVAHLAMYRPIDDHSYLTTAGAEGWAHYLGSQLVDAVYALEGETLWPDRYDYREDGSKRLTKQLQNDKTSPTVAGAQLWSNFAELVGPKKMAPYFAAWGRAQVDPAEPQTALEQTTLDDADTDKLKDWWKRAGPVLLLKRQKSDIAAETIDAKQLAGKPRQLSHDDGNATGKKSIAGSAHAVRFEAPDNQSYLTAVELFGSRYGAPTATGDFSVWLCDEQFSPITEFKFPYSKFQRGNPRWVSLPLKTPIKAPPKFIVCFGFNPAATKGVFVSHDAESSGHSLTGLPGQPPSDFTTGDWMIRAKVDQPKATDSLRGQ
jgi:hypothetical protein